MLHMAARRWCPIAFGSHGSKVKVTVENHFCALTQKSFDMGKWNYTNVGHGPKRCPFVFGRQGSKIWSQVNFVWKLFKWSYSEIIWPGNMKVYTNVARNLGRWPIYFRIHGLKVRVTLTQKLFNLGTEIFTLVLPLAHWVALLFWGHMGERLRSHENFVWKLFPSSNSECNFLARSRVGGVGSGVGGVGWGGVYIICSDRLSLHFFQYFVYVEFVAII